MSSIFSIAVSGKGDTLAVGDLARETNLSGKGGRGAQCQAEQQQRFQHYNLRNIARHSRAIVEELPRGTQVA